MVSPPNRIALTPSLQVVRVFFLRCESNRFRLSCSFSSSPLWCGFLIQNLKLLLHSCLTTVPPFLTQVTAHFLFLLLWSVVFHGPLSYCSFSCPGRREGEKRRGMEFVEAQGNKKAAEKQRERAHMLEKLKDALRGREGSQLMLVKQMEWVCEGEKKGGRVMESKVSHSSVQSEEKNGRKDEKWRGGDLLFMCLW